MKKIITCVTLCLMAVVLAEGAFADMKDYISHMNDALEPKDNEVAIHFNCVEVPLDKILLVRKDSNYCALKFTKYWTEKDGKEKFAAYTVYFQGDSSGDFSKINVTKSEDIASAFPLKGLFRPFIYQPGNSYIKCGSYKLTWNYKKKVGVMPPDKGQGDFGFELAPTPWSDIKEVNIKDPRVKWYQYDEKRERVFIPIDKLWDESGKNEERKEKK